MMGLRVVPLTLEEADALVDLWHRHRDPVGAHRWSIGAVNDQNRLVGACIVGRPVARGCAPYTTAEVTRLVTNGTRNACSLLYAAAARAATAMGYDKIQTYTLETEPGTSLRAVGWTRAGVTSLDRKGWETRDWGKPQTPIRKVRWEKTL